MNTQKLLVSIACGLAATLAADAIAPSPIVSTLPPENKQEFSSAPEREGFFYLRFMAGESEFSKAQLPLPGLGLGYRWIAGDAAVDLSVSGIGTHERNKDRFFWTFPKVSYQWYLSPKEATSLYLGGGLAWGGIYAEKTEFFKDDEGMEMERFKTEKFVGILPSAMVGYEFARHSSILGFVEFAVSQPALAVEREEGMSLRPFVELSTGIGF